MSDPLFADEEEVAVGVGGGGDDLFATPEEEAAAGVRGPVEPEPEAEPELLAPIESKLRHAPKETSFLDDLISGVGNTLNLDRGAVRAGRALGLIDDQLAEDTLSRMEYDEQHAGPGRAVGRMAGDIAAGAVTGPLGAGMRGAAAVGAAEAGVSELARTGDVGEALKGSAVGAVTGGVGHKLASAMGPAADALRAKLPAGELQERLASKAAREAQDLAALSGMDVATPDLTSETYESLMTRLRGSAPDIAKIAAQPPSVARKAAAAGQLGPRALEDLAAARALRSPMQARDPRLAQDIPLWLGAKAADAAESAALPMSIAAGVEGSETSSASAQYSDIVDEMRVTPLDDTSAMSFRAFHEAADDPALEGYPGVRQDLVGMLSGLAAGEKPPPSQVALMEYRLSEIPGLSWQSIAQGGEE